MTVLRVPPVAIEEQRVPGSRVALHPLHHRSNGYPAWSLRGGVPGTRCSAECNGDQYVDRLSGEPARLAAERQRTGLSEQRIRDCSRSVHE